MRVIDRQAAKSKGLRRYFTGKPCPKGHVVERFVSTCACVECVADKSREWKRTNPQKASEQKRKWVANNLEKVRAVKKAWSDANPEGQRRRSRKWYEANKKKAFDNHYRWAERNRATVNAAAARYRAAKLNATPPWADHDAIASIYATASALSETTGIEYHVDHIIPLQGETVCGLHVETNLQILYFLCYVLCF